MFLCQKHIPRAQQKQNAYDVIANWKLWILFVIVKESIDPQIKITLKSEQN